MTAVSIPTTSLISQYERAYRCCLREKSNQDPSLYDECIDTMDELIQQLQEELSEEELSNLLTQYSL